MHSHSLSDVVIFISANDCCNVFTWDTTTVIKPNPAGPAGRPGIRSTWWLDRSGFNKRPAVATARPNPVTRWVDPEPRRPGRTRTRPGFFCFFFQIQMWDLKLISIYTLYFHEKNHVFSMWGKNLLV